MIHACFAGCDVSAHWLDLCILSPEGSAKARFANDAAGQADLAERLRSEGAPLLVLEASGGCEAGLMSVLWAAGLPLALVEAGRVRAFARALAEHAKTDRIDARIIARFAAATGPEPTPPPCEITRDLRALVARRRVLVEIRADERKRRHRTPGGAVRASIDAHIAALSTEIARFEVDIAALIAQHPPLRDKACLMRSMPGIGPATVAVLLAELPQLGAASASQLAALAGLAPFARESGAWRGRRSCKGGRKPPRDALFMAATSAVFHSQNTFRDRYERFIAAGKPHKVALIAVMRKMLVTLNAMLKSKTKYAT